MHFDTTPVDLYGDYLSAAEEEAPFNITRGYSKDRRPDLKQVVVSLLCVGTDVPLVGRLKDGNASDKTLNHRLLSEVSRHLKAYGVQEQVFIYIADSAMVTEANLAQAADRTPFITHLPATYKEHERVINSALEAGQWAEVGRIAQTPAMKHHPGASDRVHEDTVTLYGTRTVSFLTFRQTGRPHGEM